MVFIFATGKREIAKVTPQVKPVVREKEILEMICSEVIMSKLPRLAQSLSFPSFYLLFPCEVIMDTFFDVDILTFSSKNEIMH